LQARLTPARLSVRKSPDADDVVTDAVVVAVDCDAEQELPQAWIWPVIVKTTGVAEVKPGALAPRAYPTAALSIRSAWLPCTFPKAATPFELVIVVVPVSVPPSGLVAIKTVTGVPLAEESAGLRELLFASTSCTVSGEPVELNPVRMSESTAVSAGFPVNLRLHCPVTDTVSGEEFHTASLLSKLSIADNPHAPELAVQGASAVMSTVKGLPALPGRVSVTEEAGSAEYVAPVGPLAPVMTKSAGAVNVSCSSVSFGSLLVTVKV
jgi:hypothetical protein